jgi:ParB/RepB/Spo0J family partition protein
MDPAGDGAGMNEAPVLIDISQIVSNPYQVRQAEDPAVVAELAANIEKNTLLQPPTVRLRNDVYELAFGHTRLAAFKLLADGKNNLAGQHKKEFEQMPCFVKDLDDLQMFEMAVAENIKRRDLNPIERAKAMQTYMETFKKTSAETGEFFNCDEATVRGTVRLLGLPEIAREKLSNGEITVGMARQLLVLVRVAPDQIEYAIDRVVKEIEPVDKVIEGILDGLAYKNKAVKMWASWRNGKPSAGNDLWLLDMPTSQIAKTMPDLSVMGDVNMRLAKKALPLSSDPVIHGMSELKDWVNKLQSGLVSAEALIAQRADAETVEKLDQLIHPPACASCSFYVKAGNNHYCTWKVCHTRKKEAWTNAQLIKKEKSLEIKSLSMKEAHAGFVALEGYSNSDRALIEKKDSNLRLHIKPAQYDHPFTGTSMIEVVTIAPKAVQAKKESKQTESSSHNSNAEWQKKYEREQKLRNASKKFQEAEVVPLFATLLDGLDNLGFLMALARFDDDNFKPDDGGKELTRKEKLRRCRIEFMSDMLENEFYENEEEGPVACAESLQGIAKTWGLALPKDWLERAKAFEPESVATETESEPEPDEGRLATQHREAMEDESEEDE